MWDMSRENIFKEQTVEKIIDICEKLMLPKEVKKQALTLLDENIYFKTRPSNLAASLLYIAGIMEHKYVAPEFIYTEYYFYREGKNTYGKINAAPSVSRIHKMNVLNVALKYMKQNFKNIGRVYIVKNNGGNKEDEVFERRTKNKNFKE